MPGKDQQTKNRPLQKQRTDAIPWYHLILSYPHGYDLSGYKHIPARSRALPYIPDTILCFRQSAREMYSSYTATPSRSNRRLSALAFVYDYLFSFIALCYDNSTVFSICQECFQKKLFFLQRSKNLDKVKKVMKSPCASKKNRL